MKPILLVVAHEGFQPLEYSVPKNILSAADFEVKTASDLEGVAISAINQTAVKVDLALKNVVVSDYEGIFFIGGPRALEFLDNETSYWVIRETAKTSRVWGAICISPRILVAAGVLSGKKVTGWDGDGELADILKKADAIYVPSPVVIDGNLITANGPAAAEEFGQAIVKLLNYGNLETN